MTEALYRHECQEWIHYRGERFADPHSQDTRRLDLP